MPISLDGTLGINSSGNVTAPYYYGNGAFLTGVSGGGNGTGISSGNSSITFDAYGNAVINIDGANIATFVPEGLVLDGNLIPSANIAYTLGNATNQWKDLWVSNNTIYMNSIPINLTTAVLANGTVVDTLAVSSTPVIVQQQANVSFGNLAVAGQMSAPVIVSDVFNYANGTPLISNTGTLEINTVVATGNITGDVLTANSANILGDIFFVNGTASGDIMAENITLNGSTTANFITANVQLYAGVGILTDGNIDAVGNIAGNYFIGNGSLLTGLPATYGNANVTTLLSSGNVTSNIVTTGNVISNNLALSGAVSFVEAAGTIAILPSIGNTVDLGNTRLLFDMTPVNAGGQGNIGTVALPFFSGQFVNLTGTDTITAGNFVGDGSQITNLPVGNYSNINVIALLNSGNLTSNIITTANVTAQNFVGNGAALTGMYGNANVAAYLPTYTGDISANAVNALGEITSFANVVAAPGGYFIGDGSLLTGLYGNANVETLLSSGTVTANMITSGNVSGTSFFGDGSQLTGMYGNAAVEALLSSGTVTANIITTGNIDSDFLLGNGYFLSGVVNSDMAYGNANVSGYLASGNANANIITTATLIGQDLESGNTLTVAGNADVGGFLTVQSISGGSMQIAATGTLQNISLSATGNIDVGSTFINRVSDPIQSQDAATKNYVDALAQGLNVKSPVAAATAAVLPDYTYLNGTAGVGATITADAVGNLVVDGVLLAATDRVLIKNETAGNAAYNGIYEVTTAGDPATAFELTRSVDNDTPAQIYGSLVFAVDGTVNAATSWFNNNVAASPITMGTTAITWTQFSSASIGAGNGLSQTGRLFNVNIDPATTTINGSNQVAVKASANLVTPNIGNAVGNSLTLTANVTTSANITSGGATIAGNLSTGNLLTNGYFYANGVPLTFSSTGINNGTSNIAIPLANSAIQFTVNGNLAGAVGTNVAILGNASGLNGFYVNPVRNDLGNTANVVYYNAATNELTYAPTAPTYGNVNVAAYLANATTNGDIYGGAIRANGLIIATGNITSGDSLIVANSAAIGTNMTVGGNTAVTGAVSAAAAAVSGNVTANNVTVTNTVTTANVVVTNLTTAAGNMSIAAAGSGLLLVSANTPAVFSNTTNSINTITGAVTVAGGVGIGGNLNVGGNFSAANSVFANITVTNTGLIGNLTVPGLTVLTGNAATGNINVTGAVSATGNVSAAGITVAGNATVAGNITGANLITSGQVAASGNASAANFITSGTVAATGAVTGGTLNTTGTATVGTLAVVGNATVGNNITVNSTITGGNIATAGTVTATGNVTGGNFITAGLITAGGNMTAVGNIAGGNAAITGNLSASYIFASVDVVASSNVNALAVNTPNIYGSTIEITATGTSSDISFNTNGTGNIVVNSTYINGVLNPVQAQDVATKGYVDSVATGLQVLQSSNVATTVALPAYAYNNGALGVGATITGNVNGVLIIDTITTTVGMRVLVKDETSTAAPFNGVYDVTTAGDAGNVYVLTRSADNNTADEMYAAYTFITQGADNAATSYTCTAVATTPINIGFDAINWVQFSAAAEYTNGNGLALTGTVFSVNVDNNTTAIVGANVVVKASANLTTPNIGNATGNSLTLTGSGNIVAVNLALSGLATVTGNLTSGNATTGTVTASGNVSGANLISAGLIDAVGTATVGNLITAGLLSVVGTSTLDDSVSMLTNLFVGPVANTATLTGPVIFAQGAANAFSQIGLQSINGNSSADLIAYADNGSDSDGFADVGMTGNTFNDTNFTITKANDGYLFVQGTADGGGNLVLATGDVGTTHDIVFATGGFLTVNEQLRLVDATKSLLPYANAAFDLGSATNSFGNVFASTVNMSGNLVANNITAVSNVSGGNVNITGVSTLGVTATVGNIGITGTATVAGNITVVGNSMAGNVQALSGAVTANNLVGNTLVIAGTTDLGVVGNVRITGGANGQAILTDGTGNLFFGNAGTGGGNVTIPTIPAVYFTSPTNANNVSFTNVVLGGYPNAQSMSVFFNGALLENSFYTLSADTLTINTPLVVGDTIDIPTQFGGNFVSINNGYGNSNVAAFFTNYLGDINPGLTNAFTLGNSTNRWNTVSANNIIGNGLLIEGNAVITGNANIQGTLTFNNTTTITTSNLVLGLGNNQTGINVTGGGIVVGNTAEAQWLYNQPAQTWNTNLGITAVGNITGNVFIGNGSQLTGIVSSYGNSNVTALLASGNVSSNVITTANIRATQVISTSTIVGLDDIVVGNTANTAATKIRITSFGPNAFIQTGNGTAGTTGNIVFAPYGDATPRVVVNTASGNVAAAGNVSANFFIGNGSQLTGISAAEPNWTNAGTIQAVGVGATTTAPTISTAGVTKNSVLYKQLGPKTWQIMANYELSSLGSGASGGTGDYLFNLPLGLQFDTTLPNQSAYQASVLTSSTDILPRSIPNSAAYAQDGVTFAGWNVAAAGPVVWDATRYRVMIPTDSQLRCLGSAWFDFTNSATPPRIMYWTFTFQSQ